MMALHTASEPAEYDVGVVEADEPRRTRLVAQVTAAATLGAFETAGELTDKLADGRPAVVVFGPSLADQAGFVAVRTLAEEHPEIGVVLVAEELTTELLQLALRAGVRDALTLAESETTLGASVERVGRAMVALAARPGAERAVRPGRVIVSFSTKGGVGKSILATNLSVALAQRSARPVVLVDADLQFGDVAVLLGIPPERTVVDAAAAIDSEDPDLMRQLVMRHPASGLLVLPAPVEPSTADQVKPEQMIAVVEALKMIAGHVVIDMPPHFDDFVLALIDVADEVLLVASLDIPSIKNLKVGMQTLDLLSLAGPKLKLVLNRANARVKLDVKEVERALGLEAKYPIPSDIAVPQAVNRGVPVVLDSPRSPAARALEQIAESVLGLPNGNDLAQRRRWGRT